MCVARNEFSTKNLWSKHSNTCLPCFIPPRKVLLHIILYIHLNAEVCRLKAACHTILLSQYLCVKLEAEFSTINLRSKHSNTCLHVSFHPGKCLLHIILYIHFRHFDLKQHFMQHYCPCTCVCSNKRIFDHKFTVQTFKYLLACLIQSRKVLLHIISYIHLHAYVFRLKAAFHTILLSLYLCV